MIAFIKKSFLILFFSAVFFEICGRIIMNIPYIRIPIYKEPLAFFNYFSDTDVWTLNYKMSGPLARVTKKTHKLVGWRNKNYDDDFIHSDFNKIQNRRPILMYGDSFGACSDKLPTCFQDYFNADPELNKKCFFLNYSTGAHGIDQIYLVMKNSVAKYTKPYVLLSALTLDADRNAVAAFTSPKPFFEIDDQKRLILRGVPVPENPADFFDNRELDISIFFLKYIENKLNGFNPFAISEAHKDKVQTLTASIVEAQINFLRNSGVDFSYLIFVPDYRGQSEIWQSNQSDWRFQTISSKLRELRVPFFSTREWSQEHIKATRLGYDEYFIPNDGHPTDSHNKMIFDNLKSKLFNGICHN
jgi:hypothetical protein